MRWLGPPAGWASGCGRAGPRGQVSSWLRWRFVLVAGDGDLCLAEPSGQLLMIVGRAVGQQGCEVGQELVLAEVEVPGTLVVGRMRAGGIPGLWKRAVETAGGPEEFDAAVGRMLDHVVD